MDYEDSALIVNYEVETLEVDSRGNVVEVLERKPEIRRLKIRSLSADKNMAQLANDIIDKCKYIHASRVEEIEALLLKLKKFHLSRPSAEADQSIAAATAAEASRLSSHAAEATSSVDKRSGSAKKSRSMAAAQEEVERPTNRRRGGGGGDDLPRADMNELEEYLEMLYQVSGKSEKEREEGLRLQERGTAMILKLCRDVINLEQLIQNSTVMGALTRVLQEEYKKSIDLTFNILRIFLAFSNFMEMHSLMANYRIGVLTMKAIEFEVKRTELREAERVQREEALTNELAAAKDNPLEYPKVLERVKKQREREVTRQKQFIRKQDRLLFVGFYILLNLAEDANVERKMLKKGLIPSLLAMLSRSYGQLLILTMTFLKKLSIFEENKDSFKECNIVETLTKFVPCSSQDLVLISLRLLFNLSFDRDLRDQMLKCGYVPKLVNLLKIPLYRAKTLKLLYHLSVDDRCKSMITYTDAIPMLMGLVLRFPQDLLAKELAALMINLSYHPRNIEIMLNNKGLNLLMDRFADKRDILLMKIIRNISLWTFNQQQEEAAPELSYRFRGLWSPHVKPLLEIMLEEKNHDLIIEIVGCLANMTVYDLPATSNWSKLLRDHGLLGFFTRMLVPGLAQNDLLLEIIMLITTTATDSQACDVLASGNLINTLYQLLKEKGEDVEILLQLLNCFHRLMMHSSSAEAVLFNTRIFADLVDCLDHRNAAVRAKAEQMSDIVLEYDRKPSGELGAMGTQIIKRRFETYNKGWLNAMGGMQALLQSHYFDGEMEDESFSGSIDRLPSSQEHELSMLTTARYLGDDTENYRSQGDWHK